MKSILLAGIAAVLLSGCIAVPYDHGRPYRHASPAYYQSDYQSDRDRDGVPDRADRRPRNPQRY